MLAYVASAEGLVAAENALGGRREVTYDVIPGVVFTVPEVADAGLTEAQAVNQGYDVRCATVLFRNLGKPHVIGEIAGEAKVVFEGGSGKILGVHLVGPHASDLIAEGTLALKVGCTVQDLAETMRAHPTLAEIYTEVSFKALGRPLHG
jgi:dihydrolipoamide dehydrogenase